MSPVFGGTTDQRTLALMMSGTVQKRQERTEVLPENEPCNSGAGKLQLIVLLRYVRLLINIVCLYSSRQLVDLTFQQLLVLLKHLHLLENDCTSTCFGRNSGQYAHFLILQ